LLTSLFVLSWAKYALNITLSLSYVYLKHLRKALLISSWNESSKLFELI